MNALVIDRVSLRVGGQPLFSDLSVRVEPGTVTSVIGRSGSGKSSLLAFLCGTLPGSFAASGRILLGDEDLTSAAPEKRRLGILFQDALLFPHLSVRDNLLFGLRPGESRRVRRQHADDALESMGLAGFGDRDPETLSGGQKSRVALLRVLLSEPRALLLDEPFSSLDDDSRNQVRLLVFDQARAHGLPTLLVTHDREDVEAAAGPVVSLTDN
ncbi:MAG: ATP-binding cassette domain-containing protein [Woeseiaceae bacterium]|nr:ATP-binding cassette domain-containing protein [Woeseiaceae bacterium]